jgi:hypothetical protein
MTSDRLTIFLQELENTSANPFFYIIIFFFIWDKFFSIFFIEMKSLPYLIYLISDHSMNPNIRIVSNSDVYKNPNVA